MTQINNYTGYRIYTSTKTQVQTQTYGPDKKVLSLKIGAFVSSHQLKSMLTHSSLTLPYTEEIFFCVI